MSEKAASKAGSAHKEIKQALDLADEQPEDAIFLIPVKLEPCDVPDGLSHVQWVNLYKELGWDRLLHALKQQAQECGIN